MWRMRRRIFPPRAAGPVTHSHREYRQAKPGAGVFPRGDLGGTSTHPGKCRGANRTRGRPQIPGRRAGLVSSSHSKRSNRGRDGGGAPEPCSSAAGTTTATHTVSTPHVTAGQTPAHMRPQVATMTPSAVCVTAPTVCRLPRDRCTHAHNICASARQRTTAGHHGARDISSTPDSYTHGGPPDTEEKKASRPRAVGRLHPTQNRAQSLKSARVLGARIDVQLAVPLSPNWSRSGPKWGVKRPSCRIGVRPGWGGFGRGLMGRIGGRWPLAGGGPASCPG